jgi:D-alanyl-lipoteichoic acid acyltransferase DltB (MBOAT superfamily)
MAIGLARLFGIKFPINFDSPYQAGSINEFWSRWHITLTRFLREYLYFPLGGNRCGPWRHAMNILATMLLSGLWHGAGWTYVIWGGLHGFYLVVTHQWHRPTKWRGGELIIGGTGFYQLP